MPDWPLALRQAEATSLATIIGDPKHDPYWSAGPQERPAVYVHRLVVAHEYAGLGRTDPAYRVLTIVALPRTASPS
jgi:hypothetical protein